MQLNAKFVYNPDVEYFFLSVTYVGESPAWIRRPFLTKEEIDSFIINEYLPNSHYWRNLEIYPESLLRALIHLKDDKGEFVEVDIRTSLFDDRYSSRSDYYQGIVTGGKGIRYKSGFSSWAKSSGFIDTNSIH